MTADIRGRKFADLNRDGIWQPGEGERPLNGFSIYLDGSNGFPLNNRFDEGEAVVISGDTGRTGEYFFPNVPPGTYRINEVLTEEQEHFFRPTNLPLDVIVPGDVGNRPIIPVEKYYDRNLNSFRDEGEPGLAGVTVFLDLNEDGKRDANEPFEVTDAEGKAIFDDEDLEARTYHVREELDQIYKPTTPDIVIVDLGQGELEEKVEFGNAYKEGMIIICKFLDENRNGKYDPEEGEQKLEDWEFLVYEDTNGNEEFDGPDVDRLIERGTTDQDGIYMFMAPMDFEDPVDDPHKTFFVREVPQDGFRQTNEEVTNLPITLPPAGTKRIDFGNASEIAMITGIKFQDLNGDGDGQLFDSDGDGELDSTREPGLEGWTIYLDLNGNGSLDIGEPTAITNEEGRYKFTVDPGTYNIREVQQLPFVQSTPAPVTVTVGRGGMLTVDTNPELAIGNAVGSIPPPSMKFEDLNRNGIKDPNEPGLEGWTIYLDLNENGILDGDEPRDITDAEGNYSFTNLQPGITYQVREVLPGPDPRLNVQTTPNPRLVTPRLGSDATLNVRTDVNGDPVDFGNAETAKLTGIKFRDDNGDGIWQYEDTNIPPIGNDLGDREPGLEGWTIYLDLDVDGSLTIGEPTAITDENGMYMFNDLAPGIYNIREVEQPPFVQSTPAPVTVTVGNADLTVETNPELAIGNAVASITGMKFEDINANRIKDPNEPVLEGWTIYADLNINGIPDPGEPSDVTDDQGNYFLTDLEPGRTYEVREVIPGPDPTLDVQTTPNPRIVIPLLGSDATLNVTGVDFGNTKNEGQIVGEIYVDEDTDQEEDIFEDGLEGFTVFLDLDMDGILDAPEEPSQISDGTGGYNFPNLSPGEYFVRVVQQDGFFQTNRNNTVSGSTTPPRDWNVDVALGSARTADLLDREVLLDANERELDEEFGFIETSISGVAFLDNNGDGIQNAGDAVFPGLALYLDENGDNQLNDGENSVITDSNGGYEFSGGELGAALVVRNAPYIVRQVPVDGVTPTIPEREVPIIGTIDGVRIEDINFANTVPNPNLQTGTPGRNNFFLSLDQTAVIQGFVDGEDFLALPSGLDFSDLTITEESDEAGDREESDEAGDRTDIRLTGSNQLIGVVIGVQPSIINNPEIFLTGAFESQIIGEAFLDNNGDGIRNEGEDGIEGLTLYLDDNSNGILDPGEMSAITSDTGGYNFPNLEAGTYVIRQVPRPGFTPTTPSARTVTIQEGELVSDVDFGLFSASSSISGVAFLDVNENGIQNIGEDGIAGLTIYLDDNNNGIFDPGEIDAVTSAAGGYLFPDLEPGTYVIGQIPSLLTPTTQPTRTITIQPGQSVIDVDFGLSDGSGGGTGSVSGVAFLDANGNGTREAGEIALPRTTVYLDSNNNGVLDNNERVRRTNASGQYSFSMVNSDVQIRAENPSDFVQTTPDGQAAAGNINFGFRPAVQSSIATNEATGMDREVDELTGTPGRRNFFMLSESKTVNIEGFVDLEDRLVLRGGLTFADLEITAGTGSKMGNTLIAIESSEEVIAELMGIEPTLIGRRDFLSM